MSEQAISNDYAPPPWPAALDEAEAVRCYHEGVDAFASGKEFYESPYPHDASCSEEDYERGYHWRRGWNDAALATHD
jgi:hypothetical protein